MRTLNKELLEKNISNAVEYDFSNQKVFGSAYAVIQDNELIYKKCFGHTCDDQAAEVTDTTLFRIASMSKPITAFATLMLIDRGLISLNDKVSRYLPEFEGIHVIEATDDGKLMDKGPVKNPPTVLHMLTHTSGFGTSPIKSQYITADDKSTLDKNISAIIRQGLDFEPFTVQAYSGYAAHDVLVKIIETVTKTDFECFLKKELFAPCNMTDTAFVPTEEQWSRLIKMHNKEDEKSVAIRSWDRLIFADFPCTHYLGGAGLVSTLSDYIKFATMLLNEGAVGDTRLISKETFRLMRTPHVPEEIMPLSERWGLSVRVIIKNDPQGLTPGTFGWSGAFGTHFWVDPENKIVAVFMKNSFTDGGAANESARNFERAVVGALT